MSGARRFGIRSSEIGSRTPRWQIGQKMLATMGPGSLSLYDFEDLLEAFALGRL